MSSPTEKRRLAAIMFTDMVGYSALSQRDSKLAVELLEEHRQLLREIFPRFHGAEIKTIGDAFLVEFSSALEAAQCGIEIQRALAKRNADAPAERQIEIRIGIHIGDVVHRGGDVYGDGVNIASRIEQLANAGGICVSMDVERQIRNALEARFEKLAPTELKNISVPMDLFRIALPWERRGTAVVKSEIRSSKSETTKWIAAAAILLLIGIGWWWTAQSRRQAPSPASSAVAVTEKSIAVLPFENLSEEKQNEYFADGVQDEILTNLARIADLKVISRTSVMQYKSGTTRNLRQIAQELGVAYILEGSVQRAGNRVRVSAQLLDARKDTHLWAEHYDRPLDDVFAIQSEVAEGIANQLQAKLSPDEKAAIEQRPTANLAAHDLYVRAKALGDLGGSPFFSAQVGQNLLHAARLLEQAIAQDKGFFFAYYGLADANDRLYFYGFDHTRARLALADSATATAVRLRPNSGEAHLALGRHLYMGYRDYERARAELITAQKLLPNEPWAPGLIGFIDRRQGRWEEHIHNIERALEVDPRNFLILQEFSVTYSVLRRYDEMAAVLDRALALDPGDPVLRVGRAAVEFESRANPQSMHKTIELIVTGSPSAAPRIANQWLNLALCERDWAGAARALASISSDGLSTENTWFPRSWFEGITARVEGDSTTASAAFVAARVEVEKVVRDQPDYSEAIALLGMIDAALGRKEDAIREGQRAVELLPVAKDIMNGVNLMRYLAIIYAWSGEKDRAIDQLSAVVKYPGYLSYARLKLHPEWDPLRDDPRFEKIVASLAPKQ